MTNPLNKPWHIEYASSHQSNGVQPTYIVDCTGRKIGTVWGPVANREAIAEAWANAGQVETSDAPQQKYADVKARVNQSDAVRVCPICDSTRCRCSSVSEGGEEC